MNAPARKYILPPETEAKRAALRAAPPQGKVTLPGETWDQWLYRQWIEETNITGER